MDLKNRLKNLECNMFIFVLILLQLCVIWLYHNASIIRAEFREKKPNLIVPDILEYLSNVDTYNPNSLPKDGKFIFFLETSKPKKKGLVVTISARQACAVESTARLNPHLKVFLIFIVPLRLPEESCRNPECKIIHELLKIKNVAIRTIDPLQLVGYTPLEKWYKDGNLRNSSYLIEHTSDFCMYLILWKYGGIYLSLDVLTLKSFEDLKPNFVGELPPDNVISSAVLNFDLFGSGHFLAELCLSELEDRYAPADLSNSGSGVIRRVLQHSCHRTHLYNSAQYICKDDDAEETPSAFSTVTVVNLRWRTSLEVRNMNQILETIKGSFAILYEDLSEDRTIDDVLRKAYETLASKRCPQIYRESLDIF